LTVINAPSNQVIKEIKIHPNNITPIVQTLMIKNKKLSYWWQTVWQLSRFALIIKIN